MTILFWNVLTSITSRTKQDSYSLKHITSKNLPLDGGGEVTVGRDHDHGDISLGGTGNHVLDEVAVARGIDDGVVPLLSEEFLGGDGDGHTTFTLFLLTVHVEGEGEGALTQTVGFSLQLFQFTLTDTAQLEEQVAGSGGLTTIDVAANDDGKVFLAFRHLESCSSLRLRS